MEQVEEEEVVGEEGEARVMEEEGIGVQTGEVTGQIMG